MMTVHSMLRRFSTVVVVSLFAGCAAKGPGPLYMWESFPRQQYSALLRDGTDPNEQIRTLEAHAEKARAGHAALPPGFRAHLGLLYMDVGNPARAKELWQAETTAFPESAHYMESLLKKLDAPTPPVTKENPA